MQIWTSLSTIQIGDRLFLNFYCLITVKLRCFTTNIRICNKENINELVVGPHSGTLFVSESCPELHSGLLKFAPFRDLPVL